LRCGSDGAVDLGVRDLVQDYAVEDDGNGRRVANVNLIGRIVVALGGRPGSFRFPAKVNLSILKTRVSVCAFSLSTGA